jgi:argininosuccinate lyase
VQGSQAYARALAKAGVLTNDEAGAIVRGLDTVAGEWEAGAFRVRRCLMRHRCGRAASGCAAVATQWPSVGV